MICILLGLMMIPFRRAQQDWKDIHGSISGKVGVVVFHLYTLYHLLHFLWTIVYPWHPPCLEEALKPNSKEDECLLIENLVRLLQWWNGGFYLYAGIFVGYQTNNLIMILVFEATTAFWSNQTLEMISQDMSIRKCFTNDVAWIHVLGWPSLALVLKEIDHFLEIQHYRHYHDQNQQQQQDDEEENKEQPKECTEQRFQYHKLHCGSMDDRKANDESTPILG